MWLPLLAVKYEELYCFSFNPKLDKEEREQGWMLIELGEEYRRMGLPNTHWQLSDVNRDYRVSGASGGLGYLTQIKSCPMAQQDLCSICFSGYSSV